MSYGYSRRLVDANKKASSSSVGVRLGRLCIRHDIPVATVAGVMGVSRVTVYNWFSGTTTPAPALEQRIREWVKNLPHSLPSRA